MEKKRREERRAGDTYLEQKHHGRHRGGTTA
jgi:hypothetical protein